jgi:succinate dehydrogenase/fumarate reductase flavoprotein subunit
MRCDVLVIGSGAAGLSAAVTAAHQGLRVVLAEKHAVFGGTTAWSGGWAWVPGNPLARRAGIDDPPKAARAYLAAVLGNRFDAARVDAFLTHAPRVIEFLEKVGLRFEGGLHIPDTYADVPGAGTGGRSVIAAPYDGRDLGPLIHRLRRPLAETSFLGMTIQAGADLRAFLTMTRSAPAFAHVTRRILRHFWHLARYGRGMDLRNGNALVARLLRAAADAGVDLRHDCPALRLTGDGARVTGAVLRIDGAEVEVTATRGVILASGGFPHDAARRDAQFPAPHLHRSLAVPTATGDGLRMAEAAGATQAKTLASPAALCPVSVVPYRDGSTGTFPHIIERGKPGIIAVLADGRRFCNEGLGYHDYVTALLRAAPDDPQSWLICTRAFQRRYGLGIARPFPLPLGPWLRSGYLVQAPTVQALAQACGINSAGLAATLADYNTHAAQGEDPAFGRGSTPYMRLQGDAAQKPNPCVAPIDRGPFLALRVIPGSFGTFAGLATDAHARVLTGAGEPIPGLYAAGADMASVMGGHYPAGGINIGPALTFGHIAAMHVAGKLDT